jgi:hypothetical protein
VLRARDERDRARSLHEVADLRLARARPDPDRDEPAFSVATNATCTPGRRAAAPRRARRARARAHERGRERVRARRVLAPRERRVAGRVRERVGMRAAWASIVSASGFRASLAQRAEAAKP